MPALGPGAAVPACVRSWKGLTCPRHRKLLFPPQVLEVPELLQAASQTSRPTEPAQRSLLHPTTSSTTNKRQRLHRDGFGAAGALWGLGILRVGGEPLFTSPPTSIESAGLSPGTLACLQGHCSVFLGTSPESFQPEHREQAGSTGHHCTHLAPLLELLRPVGQCPDDRHLLCSYWLAKTTPTHRVNSCP